MYSKLVNLLSYVVLSLAFLIAPQIAGAAAIGHNGRIDMLHTVNHKEKIDNILNKRYTGDAAPGGEIHHVKNIVQSKKDRLKKGRSEQDMSRKTLLMAAKNGFLINTELDNVVTNILEASEIVERESMI